MNGRALSLVGIADIAASRFGRRLLGLLLGCALLPLAGFAWLSVTKVSSQLWLDAEKGLHISVKSLGMDLAERLSRLRTDFEIARAEWNSRGAGALRTVSPTLRERLTAQFRSIHVFDGAAASVELGDPPLPFEPLEARERDHLSKGRPLVRAAVREPGGEAVTWLVHRADDGTRSGDLFVAEIHPNTLWDSEGLFAGGAEIMVLGEDGEVLHSSVAERPAAGLLRATLAKDPASGTFEWSVAGEPHLARYWRLFLRPQLGLDWVVVQSRPTASVLAPLFGFQRFFALFALLTLLVVVTASLVQVRRTLGPIAELEEATRKVAAGEFAARVEITTSDEIGELGRSFNAMTDRLVENIRRREQTEKALVTARDEALAAGRAKAEFLTNVSHELRTPLTSILSSSEILRTYPDEDPTMRAEFLTMIVDQAQHLTMLIDKVLELSSGKDELDRVPLDLAETLHWSIQVLPPRTRARVRLQIVDELPSVAGAHDRLVQLWLHLIDNAAKFSPPDTSIDVVASARDGVCVVEVRDRGVGIATADLERIFEPFCQVGRDILTEKAPGTGLGLTLARSVAERHGGRIEVESSLGVGSTFRVVLPACAKRPVAAMNAH